MLKFACPNCGKRLKCGETFAGKKVLCPGCNATVTVPKPKSTAMTATAPHLERGDTYSEGEPPRQHDTPPIRKKAQQIPMRGCVGGILTALISAAIAFLGGFLPYMVLVSFLPHGGGGGVGMWFLLAGIQAGIGSAFVGGILGLIAGTIGGPRTALIAAFTKGIVGALIGAPIGAVIGFVVGDAAHGLEERKLALTDAIWRAAMFASLASLLGFVMGTIFGTWNDARKQKEKRGRQSL